jgi:hypothetical protein
MIIGTTSRFGVYDLLKYVGYCLWALLGISLLSTIAVLFFYSGGELKREEVLTPPKMEKEREGEAYVHIGEGPLSLRPRNLLECIPGLNHEISVLAKKTRPDGLGEGPSLLLFLHHSKEERIVTSGQKIYLNREMKEGVVEVLHFAEEETPFWISPLLLDSSSTLVEVGIKSSSSAKEERGEFVLETCERIEKDRLEERLCCRVFSDAKWWGLDPLFEKYGGGEYKHLRDRHKLEFSEPLPSICFIKSGDYLTWENEEWSVVPLERARVDRPLARVQSLNARHLQIEVWDETGFSSTQIKLSPQTTPKMNYKIENLPSSLRLRTSSQITCLLGKRRVILKQGDWLLKTSSGWHILKRREEIEECLQHRLRGDLLIFDELDRQEGRAALKGSLFDEMRTQLQPIVIPVAGDKKNSRVARKKRHILSKKEFVSPPSATNGKNPGATP